MRGTVGMLVLGLVASCSGGDRDAAPPPPPPPPTPPADAAPRADAAERAPRWSRDLPAPIARLLADDAYVYAEMVTNGKTQLVRMPVAGGELEPVASFDAELRATVLTRDAILTSAGGHLMRIPKKRDATPVSLAAGAVSAIAVAGEQILVIAPAIPSDGVPMLGIAPTYASTNQVLRLDAARGSPKLVAMTGTLGLFSVAPFALAVSADRIFISSDGHGVTSFELNGELAGGVGLQETPTALAASATVVYAVGRDEVEVVVEHRKVLRVIPYLDEPVVAPCASGAAIATRTRRDHIAGFDGVVLWYDVATDTLRTVSSQEADAIATDCHYVYAAKGNQLLAIAL